MIDTLRLKFEYPLPRNSFYFQEPTGRLGIYTNSHWRDHEQDQGFYIPKYWMERDFRSPAKTLFCLEASLPKLLYGQNIKEIEEQDFNKTILALNSFFSKLGIIIPPEEIANSIPTVVAIGKNINISDLCRSSAAMELLKPFDYKSRSNHRTIEFSDCGGGKELLFSIKSETLKVYEKMRELANKAQTTEELELVRNWQDAESKDEILRFELTLKNRRKILSKFNPYLDGAEPTFKNIFKQSLWEQVLVKEISKVFNPSLSDLTLLAGSSQDYINDYLEKNFNQIQTRELARAVIMDIKGLGLSGARSKYLTQFKSNKSWYNLQRRLAGFDYSALTKLTSKQIHREILKRLGAPY